MMSGVIVVVTTMATITPHIGSRINSMTGVIATSRLVKAVDTKTTTPHLIRAIATNTTSTHLRQQVTGCTIPRVILSLTPVVS